MSNFTYPSYRLNEYDNDTNCDSGKSNNNDTNNENNNDKENGNTDNINENLIMLIYIFVIVNSSLVSYNT